MLPRRNNEEVKERHWRCDCSEMRSVRQPCPAAVKLPHIIEIAVLFLLCSAAPIDSEIEKKRLQAGGFRYTPYFRAWAQRQRAIDHAVLASAYLRPRV